MESDLEFILKTYILQKNPLPLDEIEKVLKEETASKENLQASIQIPQPYLVNTLGTFNMIRQAVILRARNVPNEDKARGVIINTSSVAAFDGQMSEVAYAASKAAIAGMTLPLARDIKMFGSLESECVQSVEACTSVFDTPLLAALPQKAIDALTKTVVFPQRLGKPDEFALMFLTIVENPYLNGETNRLDGALGMV
ncbi:3-hydroxyacyl-CoA dehydrogenase type-2-like [Crassostrea angulata]|uniref:3-hydroxyacyl-CoA dehydrogenase type-2-like n=1 Tax=Magallana angulata TaxID=2784310 RepID=UPI0022B0BF0E|nr:3-hydroxyacyl-CoA dehydrogenase type-2-like [Crassostrea angulata]